MIRRCRLAKQGPSFRSLAWALSLLVLFLLFGNAAVVNSLSGKGFEIFEKKSCLGELRRENGDYELLAAKMSALESVSAQAQKIGLVPSGSDNIYLTRNNQTVAIKPD